MVKHIIWLKSDLTELKACDSNNFDTAQSISLNTDFTITNDYGGYVLYGAYGGDIVRLYVNNVQMGCVYGGNQSTASSSNTFRVYKGDVVKLVPVISTGAINVHSYNPII